MSLKPITYSNTTSYNPINWAKKHVTAEKVSAAVNFTAAVVVASQLTSAIANTPNLGLNTALVAAIYEGVPDIAYHVVTGVCQLIPSDGSRVVSTVVNTIRSTEIVIRVATGSARFPLGIEQGDLGLHTWNILVAASNLVRKVKQQ